MAKRKILLAINDGETSFKAVRYVGEACAHMINCEICLLHVSPEPPPYYYLEGNTQAEYVKKKEAKANKLFDEVVEVLKQFGIAQTIISTRPYITSHAETISGAIGAVQQEGGFGTVVVGKRGVSKAEEFLFGSISNAMAQNCVSFTLWIVA